MTTNPKQSTTELLQSFIDAYDALQASDGASVYFDAGTSRTFTVGMWLGQRMAGLVEEARAAVAEERRAAKLAAAADGDDGDTLVCAICGNKQIAPLDEIIDAGWIPEFWYDHENGDGPACPGCVEHRIDCKGKEPTLKPKEDWTR